MELRERFKTSLEQIAIVLVDQMAHRAFQEYGLHIEESVRERLVTEITTSLLAVK